MAIPSYNTDHPATLFAPGRLRGLAVQLDPSSITPLGGTSGRIYRATLSGPNSFPHLRGGQFATVAVKVTEDDRTRRPRDPKREARILADLDHPNIISLLNAYLDDEGSPSSLSDARLSLFTPFYPLTLRSLLDSPTFTPDNDGDTNFRQVSCSIAYQLAAAVRYLHDPRQGIAHRDINPNNVVLSRGGRVVLIDFGISISTTGQREEPRGKMHFEVGTGAYRAPELVFASRDYDPFAIDLWALGCTLSELFRPFTTPKTKTAADDSDDSEEDSFERAYRQYATPEPESKPARQTLFDASLSDFVLAASIFRVVGTPTVETWPEAADLPNFSRFTFAAFPPTSLESHLPYLDRSHDSPLAELLPRLVKVSARERMSAAQVVDSLAQARVPLLLPDDLDEADRAHYTSSEVAGWEEGSLTKAFESMLPA